MSGISALNLFFYCKSAGNFAEAAAYGGQPPLSLCDENSQIFDPAPAKRERKSRSLLAGAESGIRKDEHARTE